MSRTTSRRAALGAFAAVAALPAGIGLANPGAGAYPDTDLIRACDTALGAWAETDSRAQVEDWDDDRVGVNVDIVFTATERAANLRASTQAGVRAKA